MDLGVDSVGFVALIVVIVVIALLIIVAVGTWLFLTALSVVCC